MIEVDTRFYKRELDPDKEVNETNRVINGYIKAIGQENCNQAIMYDNRDAVAYHLGSERGSSVAWYPFEEEAVILEVGGDFGAVTGTLCDAASKVVVTESSLFKANSISMRYSTRQNLKIYAGAASEIDFEEKFDYIVILNLVDKIGEHTIIDEIYIKNLSHLKKYLKDDGKLLLGDENLYSLWRCRQGDQNPLNPWKHIRKLDKNRFNNILKASGFHHIKFYYPLPGYHLVGRIYTEEALPTPAEWNCLSNIYSGDQNYLSNNMELLTNLLDNGMFTKMTHAFFVEAGREDNLCKIKKACVLFPDTFELPLLGYDWRQHGYSSLTESIKRYREKGVGSQELLQRERLSNALFKIDQDHEILGKVLEVELDILKKLLDVCQKHGLKLYAMYGTLLGAIRTGGIIKGDDDIDVALMRDDYDKLLTLTSEFTDRYFLQTPENDDCFYGGYLKLRNKDTTEINPQNWWTNCCEGISIDIFPIDRGYADTRKEKRKQKRIKHLQRLLYAKAYGYFADFKDMKLLKWKSYKYFGKLFTREKLASRLESALSENDHSLNAPMGIYTHYLGEREPRWLDKKAFEEVIEVSFEGEKLLAPLGYDIVLRKLYGDNYMVPNPWKEGKRRHGFYDVNCAYLEHREHFRGLFKPQPLPDQKIVLFGDGLLFDAYYEKYGTRFVPSNIVVFDTWTAENNIHGIRVQTLHEYIQSDYGSIYPVICAVDIRAAEKKLEEIGIKNYYVFVKYRDWILLANSTFVLSEL